MKIIIMKGGELYMRIIVDSDSCNKVSTIINIGKENDLEVHLFYDTSHEYNNEYCIHHQVIQGTDSADFAILNFCMKGDIVITKDAGLAAMAMAKGSYVVHTNGMEYTDNNILSILTSRHINKKERMKGNYNKSKKNNTNNSTHYNFKETINRIINSEKEDK